MVFQSGGYEDFKNLNLTEIGGVKAPVKKEEGTVSQQNWVHGDEETAPSGGTALVTHTVASDKHGFIFGFFITAQEENEFLIEWVSGGTTYSRRIIFSSAGSVEGVNDLPINSQLGADENTDIVIKNVNAGDTNKIYQACLKVGDV